MLAWIAKAISGVMASTQRPAVEPLNLIDLRKQAGKVNGSKRIVLGKRSWAKTTGVTLHQTACVLGERPERWLNVGAHIGITRGGQVLWLHDFSEIIAHGHGWNAQCVGIEIDGLYAGVQGDLKTVWDNPATDKREVGQDLPEIQANAAREAIRWIYRMIKANGGELRVVVAHRQSIDDRRSDPGSEIWQRVAMPMHDELLLNDGGHGFVIGKGMPIPEAWDPRRKGIKY